MTLSFTAARPIACLIAGALTAAPALAAPQIFTNRASWEAAVNGSIVTETFNSMLTPSIPATGTTDFGPFKLETVNAEGAGLQSALSPSAINGTPFMALIADGVPVKSTSFVFPTPLRAFGFNFVTAQPGDGTQLTFADVEFLDLRDGLKLTSGFVGFIATQSFSRIDFVSKQPSFSNTFIDDLSTVAAFPGDFNVDGRVDGSDFLRWQRDLSVGDLADWKENFGAGASAAPATAAVPEPGAMSLLAAACAGAVLCRSGTRR